MTPHDVISALRSGKTIADLAASKGMTVAQVQDKALAALRARLDQAVKSSNLSQAEADKAYSKMQQNIASGYWMDQLQKNCLESKEKYQQH
jgi:hypothetical protein